MVVTWLSLCLCCDPALMDDLADAEWNELQLQAASSSLSEARGEADEDDTKPKLQVVIVDSKGETRTESLDCSHSVSLATVQVSSLVPPLRTQVVWAEPGC